MLRINLGGAPRALGGSANRNHCNHCNHYSLPYKVLIKYLLYNIKYYRIIRLCSASRSIGHLMFLIKTNWTRMIHKVETREELK